MLRAALAGVLALALAGCGDGSARPAVAAGFYPVAFAASQLAGDRYRVVDLTPPGAEPHDLELSVGDVRTVRSAAVVLYLDAFQPGLAEAARRTEGRAVDLARGLESRPGDPHLWLDPVLYARLVERVGAALDAPVASLVARLRALDRAYRAGLAHCARRDLVAGHAAFGYLADRYRLKQIAVEGLAPEGEPTPRALERTVDAVRASGARTVFVEPLASPRVARTVARETGVRTAVLDPIEGLTKEEADRDEDYFDLMRANLRTLREALGCR